VGTPAQGEKERATRRYRIEHLLCTDARSAERRLESFAGPRLAGKFLSIGSMHIARITPTRVLERYRRYR
jgi:hypothetical protein